MKIIYPSFLFNLVIRFGFCFFLLLPGLYHPAAAQMTIGGVQMGRLPNFLFVFTNGSDDANWQAATKGYVGNVAVDGIQAAERTSGTMAFAGRIYSNDASLGAWQRIVDANTGQAFASYNEIPLLTLLEADLENAFTQINALPVTAGYSGINATSLNGLNTQNGIAQVLVINITGGFSVSSKINITGDANDVFILRWDSDANFSNGYNGQVKFKSGGAIFPLGGLKPSNFIHVAGDISSSGGGSNPAAPYPQGPRINNGTGSLIADGDDFNGGGFFTGYWLTTGAPTNSPGAEQPYGNTASLSNAIFVGGWYSKTTKFSMTSGTSGVYVGPPPTDDGPPEKRGDKDVIESNPTKTVTLHAFPNPFIQVTSLRYTLGSTGQVMIKAYNIAGNEIATLVNEKQTAGEHTFQWNASANPAGTYIILLKMEGRLVSTRVTLVK